MKKIRLLHLEDETLDAYLVKKVFDRAGTDHDIRLVSDKQSFIDALAQDTFDAILADHSLPQFTAIEALQIAREYNIKIPFILVTGTVSEEYSVQAMRDGAWDYILKDRLQRLPAAVMGAIDKYNFEQERQRYLDEIIAKEALMKEAEQLAHFGSWEADMVNGTGTWSDEKYRILGYEPGEVHPGFENFMARVHPEDIQDVLELHDNAFKKLNKLQYQCRIRCKDGIVKYIYAELVIKRGANNEVVRMNGFVQDITKSKESEELLQRSEANLRTLFDNTERGYVLLDAQLNVVSFNKQAYKFSLEQLRLPILDGTYAVDYFTNERQDGVKRSLQIALKGITTAYEVSYPQPDGHERWYHASYHPVWDINKRVLGVIMSIGDVTERKISDLQEKKITADLLQRNKDLEQFAYIISHNLRAPVANIIGVSDLLMNSETTEDERKIFMDGLNTSVKKLDDVIVDLNEILQVKHKLNENKERVVFSQLVQDIKYSISNYIADEFVDIRTDLSEVDELYTLKSYMHSIFYNLIINSIKYRKMEEAPVIEIKSYRRQGCIVLVFKDNCMGIDLEKRGDQVFGLYKRFHAHAAEGKGIGLFMVKTQVETLGGKISLTSEVNKGSEFRIEFELQEYLN